MRGPTTVVAMAVGAVVAVAALDAQPTLERHDRPFVAASYNIHHGSGNDDCTTPPAEPGEPPNPDCSLDLPRIAAVIRALDVDVVGLQEVDRFWARSGDADQARELARMLRMHHCYGANLAHAPDSHANVPHQYGTAILSRWPIRHCENTLLPRTNPGNEQRGLLEAVVYVRDVALRVYSTHLQHNSLDDRIIQVATIADKIATVTDPVVLVGDLNAVPTEVSLPPLLALLTDTWEAAGDGDGFTLPARPDVEPDRRIDYVLASSDITVQTATVAMSDRTAMASDHYPVVSGMVLPR